MGFGEVVVGVKYGAAGGVRYEGGPDVAVAADFRMLFQVVE